MDSAQSEKPVAKRTSMAGQFLRLEEERKEKEFRRRGELDEALDRLKAHFGWAEDRSGCRTNWDK